MSLAITDYVAPGALSEYESRVVIPVRRWINSLKVLAEDFRPSDRRWSRVGREVERPCPALLLDGLNVFHLACRELRSQWFGFRFRYPKDVNFQGGSLLPTCRIKKMK